MTTTWYLAICAECNGGLSNLIGHPDRITPMPFALEEIRASWVTAHMEGTGHSILLMNQTDTS